MRNDCIDSLRNAGISFDDAEKLRRIAMTLHRWHELECGDSNDYASWTITRGRKEKRHGEHSSGHGAHYVFLHDESGTPFEERHIHSESGGKAHYTAIPDRERGALKRLAAIMARYPDFAYYVQGDPRGASLYILHPNAIAGADAFSIHESKRAEWLSANYTRGIAVYK